MALVTVIPEGEELGPEGLVPIFPSKIAEVTKMQSFLMCFCLYLGALISQSTTLRCPWGGYMQLTLPFA